MPLGSESTLGLAGPNGTPLIAELPAPADPAGGQGENKLRIAGHPGLSRGCTFNDDLGRAFPQARQPCLFPE
jgi:hypothetical protein